MYRGNDETKLVHTDQCVHGRRLKKEKTRWFSCWDEAMISEYKPCKCCNPVTKGKRVRTHAITTFCKENGIELDLIGNKLYIRSALDKWVLHVNTEGKMELLHKNTWGNKKDYHVQDYKVSNLMNVLKYIKHHDNYRKHNPVPKFNMRATTIKMSGRFNKWKKHQKQSRKKYQTRQIMNYLNGLSAVY